MCYAYVNVLTTLVNIETELIYSTCCQISLVPGKCLPKWKIFRVIRLLLTCESFFYLSCCSKKFTRNIRKLSKKLLTFVRSSEQEFNFTHVQNTGGNDFNQQD